MILAFDSGLIFMAALSNRKTIRGNALAFVKEWGNETREEAEAKSFWDAFFAIFGVNRKSVAAFEHAVERTDNTKGFIDLFWKGVLLVEHKSRGKSLDKAKSQAFDYFQQIKDQRDRPRYVLLSDFARFKLYDLDRRLEHDIAIDDLPDKIEFFDFMAGLDNHGESIQEYALNIKAAERLGKLHDALQDAGCAGHELEVFLVRILFCLFAEDTGIFSRHQFYNYLEHFTAPDGSDTDSRLNKLFQTLDKPVNARGKHLLAELNDFPYVNGHLFREILDLPSFDADMREALLDCSHFDWGSISPAIFGSLFQSVMDKAARRELGAHYTSETHILRLIKPLFLDALWAEFSAIQQGGNRDKRKKLAAFQQRLTALQFLDPACGCGNFLIITYRELRRLELAVLQAQHGDAHRGLEITVEPTIKLEHFHGIEIEEWPVRIAEVAMWLTQHQMNREFARQFGREPDLLPLKSSAHIVIGNSLQLDWAAVVKPANLNHIIGNPPFRGSKMQSDAQKQELATLFGKVQNAKQLDYVACWFKKTADFIQKTRISVAFVSTNSITQGEQVAPLWQPLLDIGIHLHFAHRTFSWDSEARGKAAVHVVIVGFAAFDTDGKRIFDYPAIKGEPVEIAASNINPYLIDAPDVVLDSRNQPLGNVSPMWFGNMPLDGGALLLSSTEKAELLEKEPNAEKWLKLCLGADEFINGKERWCLWLVGIAPNELRAMPEVLKRIEQVKKFRLASVAASTRVHAERPTEFRDTRLPKTYILVPSVSSERREYVPMGFFDSNTISTNLNLMIPDASLYEFGVLESKIHMAWMRTVCGRLKSDYRYSAKLVYNNFPWPDADDKQRKKVEAAAQAVLDARKNYPTSTLADMYDPTSMPPDLRKAHTALDKAVDQCYRKEKFGSDMERLTWLFERYRGLVG
ncbi:Type II restriction/modification system, DNA methylase subunit YeeA [Thiothrix caldifontis]|uniref:site-specific DNA-methyltransferase (adenine-specific) n=2 Tax=Thiothrix caldifontis TaxID=525918 RepID=A0A1H3ZFI8_9GAMM|nr:Type II restriction/modification system, DNA methylase subunit YeeA [Thiothrix caldifontis]